MSGTPEAVPTLRSPVSASAEGSALRRSPSARGGKRSPGAISKVAWIPQAGLDQAGWLSTGRRLGTIGRCSQWWIGDWIRYGTARWGEKYAEAARVTGYDVASLRNMAWVASQFDLSLRSDKLSWSHHVLLAPLESDEKRYWLDRAQAERLSVADLRLELRTARAAADLPEPKLAGTATAAEPAVVVCPHCGHELRSSAN